MCIVYLLLYFLMQQSLAIMNMNLQDIQQDIQKLTVQQNQIQAQQLQAQQLMHAQHMANMLNQVAIKNKKKARNNNKHMRKRAMCRMCELKWAEVEIELDLN